MPTNGTTQATLVASDLVKALNAARKRNFKICVSTAHSVIPREVAAGLNDVFAANQKMAREIEELRRER